MFGFGKKQQSNVEMGKCEIKKGHYPWSDFSNTDEPKQEQPAEEWIWVNGYKGTDKDMKCMDFQYELQKCFDISEDKPVELCSHGFHLCLNMRDVQRYYPIGGNNRFFEVKALVRKKDYEKYGKEDIEWTGHYARVVSGEHKLVAKSIIFTRELTVDEIFGESDWEEEDKLHALEVGISQAKFDRTVRRLVDCGYSEVLSRIIISDGKEGIALAVGEQEGLSMDMKVWMIFKD